MSPSINKRQSVQLRQRWMSRWNKCDWTTVASATFSYVEGTQKRLSSVWRHKAASCFIQINPKPILVVLVSTQVIKNPSVRISRVWNWATGSDWRGGIGCKRRETRAYSTGVNSMRSKNNSSDVMNMTNKWWLSSRAEDPREDFFLPALQWLMSLIVHQIALHFHTSNYSAGVGVSLTKQCSDRQKAQSSVGAQLLVDSDQSDSRLHQL